MRLAVTTAKLPQLEAKLSGKKTTDSNVNVGGGGAPVTATSTTDDKLKSIVANLRDQPNAKAKTSF